MRLNFVIFIGILFLSLSGSAQLVYNGNFEKSDDCPTGTGQFENLHHWFPLVESPDFYDCGINSVACGIDGSASSGTAFVGFGAMGGGVSEGVG